MVVDTSVIAAILFLEPERKQYLEKMASASRLLLSAAGLVELGVALIRRGPIGAEREIDGFLRRAGFMVVPVDEAQANLAREAFRRFGKGLQNKAQLNFGDCFSYSLATSTGDALLFKGDDFTYTDVRIA